MANGSPSATNIPFHVRNHVLILSFGGFVLFCIMIHCCLKQRKMREEKEKRELIDGDNDDDEIFVETKL